MEKGMLGKGADEILRAGWKDKDIFTIIFETSVQIMQQVQDGFPICRH